MLLVLEATVPESSAYTLVASPGTYPLTTTRYMLGDQEHESQFCAAALARLLPRPVRVIAPLTEEARRQNWPTFQQAMEEACGLTPIELPIPDGREEAEIWAITERLVAALEDQVGQGERLVLDVTNAFRSLPFVYFAALAFLQALRGVEVAGVYYGAFDRGRPERTPIVDLSPLLTLSRWSYAVRSFREAADLAAARDLLVERKQQVFKAAGGRGSAMPFPLTRAIERIGDLQEPLAAGLPLEIGIHAREALDALAQVPQDDLVAFIASPRFLEPLRAELERFALPAIPPGRRKSAVALDLAELERQLRLIRWYIELKRYARALLLMREWVVNRVLLAQGRTADWLSREARHAAERALGALSARAQRKDPALSEAQRGLAGLWDSLADLRNAFAHPGMRPQEVTADVRTIHEKLAALEERCGDDGWWSTSRPAGALGRLLVTALGMSPGVLYTAIQHTRPEAVLVVASANSRPLVAEALAAAGAPDLPATITTIADPFTGFAEVRGLVAEQEATLLAAREVVGNVAGGTTVMQLAVQELVARAARLGVPTTVGAVVDRRAPEEQRRQPYVLGEWILLQGAADEERAAEE